MSGFIKCDFVDENEESVGVGLMANPPRVGEQIWLMSSSDQGPREKGFRVMDVGYWVPDLAQGLGFAPCESCFVYVEAT